MIYTAEKTQSTPDLAITNIPDTKLLTPIAANAQIQSDGLGQVIPMTSKTFGAVTTVTPRERDRAQCA